MKNKKADESEPVSHTGILTLKLIEHYEKEEKGCLTYSDGH